MLYLFADALLYARPLDGAMPADLGAAGAQEDEAAAGRDGGAGAALQFEFRGIVPLGVLYFRVRRGCLCAAAQPAHNHAITSVIPPMSNKKRAL